MITFNSIELLSSMHHQDTNLAIQNMDPRLQMKVSPSSSRILYDIPCKVCRDHSSGKHYGIFACDGCAGFFKRSIRRNRQYVCKAKSEGTCVVDKTHRNQCRACRLAKCQEAGMNKEAVQHERGPRNSTLRRQMALFFKDPTELISPHPRIGPGMMPPLDLSISTQTASQMPPLIAAHPFLCNPLHPQQFPLGLLTTPSTSVAPVLNPETVCESAARLLFMNVKWAKSVPAFTSLPLSDQLLLLEESWSELFVLGAAQFLMPLEIGQLVHACGILNPNNNNDNSNSFAGSSTSSPVSSTTDPTTLISDPAKTLTLLHEVKLFQETLSRFSEMSVDPHEFACLRAIVLFKTSFDNSGAHSSTSSSPGPTSERGELTNLASVIALQDHTQFTLNKYILTTQPTQPLRFGKLLLLLPALKTVSSNTIVELFFKRTIGSIPIERIICDMYKTNDL